MHFIEELIKTYFWKTINTMKSFHCSESITMSKSVSDDARDM